MTTQHHGVIFFGKPHETRKVFWATISAVAAVLCAVAVVGNVTWVEETNWFMFAFAGFGVVGFAENAVNQWRERPKGYESTWSLWLTAAFWAAFGLYNASVAVWSLAIKDDSPDWGPVAFGSVLAALFLWFAVVHVRKALRH